MILRTIVTEILRVKVDGKNYNQPFIKHDEDNNSQFEIIF